jgi:hypothetical protein
MNRRDGRAAWPGTTRFIGLKEADAGSIAKMPILAYHHHG